MKLPTRLLLLILGCLLPILAAQVFTQVKLYSERQRQLADSVQRRAEIAMSNLSALIDGIRRVAMIVARSDTVQHIGPGCPRRLATIQRDLPVILFFAVVDSQGSLLCGSSLSLSDTWSKRPAWLPDPANMSATGIGRYGSEVAVEHPFLPIAIAVPGSESGKVMVAALDLAWMAEHMAEARRSRSVRQPDTVMYLIDRDGEIIGQHPDAAGSIGNFVPALLRPLTSQASASVSRLIGEDGTTVLAAFVPAPPSMAELATIVTTTVPSPLTFVAEGAIWDILVTGGCTLAALLLAWLAGRRFIYGPTEVLLNTVQRWSDGDLNARAALANRGSEFDALAKSFNAMASRLQARESERRLQSKLLESLVAERTHELSEINNRLQVEIAEREKTEAALHQAQKLQAVGQLAGGIAHDFNNMLATVLGNLELMQLHVGQSKVQALPNDSTRMTELIERASGAVQRGAQLTSQLLAFSRRQRLSARPTDLNRLVKELVTLATSTLGRRIQVVTRLAPDLWPALIDPSQLEAAILNLCLNARDAMPEGGQLTIATANEMLETGHQHNDLRPGPYVRVSIADTGHGMAPDIRERAFDPFFTTKGPGGSGLGLSQVYGMARQSGGTIRLSSQEGVGTEVVLLLLPRATTDVGGEPANPPPVSPPRDLTKLLVLVVDDDAAVRQVAVEMLRDLGCGVAQAPSGAEALAIVADAMRQPDIILLDYAMPGMNGLQVATALREMGTTAAIALVTGYAELETVDAGHGPLDGMLRKPFTIRELRSMLSGLRDWPDRTRNGG